MNRKKKTVEEVVRVEVKPPKKGTSKSIPGPKRLTNIPKRGQ